MMSRETRDQVRRDGWDAFKAGRPCKPPFPGGDPRWSIWQHGWQRAKRDRVTCAESLG